MHDIGIELGKVAADTGWQGYRKPIFGAAGNCDRRNVDEIASRFESRLINRRRIDADVHTLLQQVADKAVQRLVGAIPDIIVIAREEGHAEVARLHGAGL